MRTTRNALKFVAVVASVATFSVGLSLAVPASGVAAGRQPAASSGSSLKWEAAIVPGTDLAVGDSLAYGNEGVSYGYSLVANGLTNYYTTCSKCTYHFVIFTFTNQAVTATITFRVIGPPLASSGKGKIVFTYSWTSTKIPLGPDWFTVNASGNFGQAGTYSAEVYGDNARVGNELLGWIPMLYTK